MSSPTPSRTALAGLLYGLAAYLSWGFIAIYFKAVMVVPPPLVLAHRVVWSVLFLAILLAAFKQVGEFTRCFTNRRTILVLLGSTTLIAANWFTFIWAASNNRLVEASLGYFINPLVNVLLGVVVLKERLNRGQLVAIGLAAAGVTVLSVSMGGLPVVSLILAVSFGLYGLLRKTAPVGPLVGLSVETCLLLPAAAWYAVSFGGGADGWLRFGPNVAFLLAAGGVVTAVPLLWFAAAARRLRFSTLGFLQYVAPTCQLLLAVIAYGEPFTTWHLISFGLIWLAIAVYSLHLLRSLRPVSRETTAVLAGASVNARA